MLIGQRLDDEFLIYYLTFLPFSIIRGIQSSSCYKWNTRCFSKFGLTPEFWVFVWWCDAPHWHSQALAHTFRILIITLRGSLQTGADAWLCWWLSLSTDVCPSFAFGADYLNVARVLITGTGQPYLLSALPQRFCFTGLQMWTSWLMKKQRKHDICDLSERVQEKLECLAVYQCIKTKSQSYSMYSKTLIEEELHTLVNYQVLVCPGHWKS